MVDPLFHRCAGFFSLAEILVSISKKISMTLCNESEVDIERNFRGVAPLDKAESQEISFLENPKYIEDFCNTKAGACVIRKEYAERAPKNTALLISDNPYYAYALIAAKFYPESVTLNSGIAESARISETAVVGENCSIGENTVIGNGVKIGNNCIIHGNVTITHSIIGEDVIIFPGASIGQDGFGYASHNGIHIKVPQLGRVIIENDVEVGAGTCIDRGSGQDTIIGAGTKIDNLVQIGHNVCIGKGCIIVAQSGVAGSTKIGDYVIIGGQAGIAGHIEIGSFVKIAGQSGIAGNLPEGAIVGGRPAVPITQYHRQTIAIQNLVKRKSK